MLAVWLRLAALSAFLNVGSVGEDKTFPEQPDRWLARSGTSKTTVSLTTGPLGRLTSSKAAVWVGARWCTSMCISERQEKYSRTGDGPKQSSVTRSILTTIKRKTCLKLNRSHLLRNSTCRIAPRPFSPPPREPEGKANSWTFVSTPAPTRLIAKARYRAAAYTAETACWAVMFMRKIPSI